MLTDFSAEYSQRSDDELLQVATQRRYLTNEAATALDAELRRRNLTESDRVEHQKFVKRQERREFTGRRRKIFGKRQFSWLELISTFVAMGVIAWAYFALPKRYHLKPDWEEAAICVMIASVFRHSRVEILVAKHHVLDSSDPFCCHSIGGCPCLGTALGRTEP
jgi:hypothetical protein